MTIPPIAQTTTSVGATNSTAALKGTLRAAMLDFVTPSGTRARDVLGERFYQDRASDETPAFPYAVMRLQTQNAGDHHGLRLRGKLEVQVFGRPWSQQRDVEAIADAFDQAMTSLIACADGVILCPGKDRQTLPAGPAPVDAEVCTVRLTYTLVIWPAYLTVLSQASA